MLGKLVMKGMLKECWGSGYERNVKGMLGKWVMKGMLKECWGSGL
jgi:hypothetical protein